MLVFILTICCSGWLVTGEQLALRDCHFVVCGSCLSELAWAGVKGVACVGCTVEICSGLGFRRGHVAGTCPNAFGTTVGKALSEDIARSEHCNTQVQELMRLVRWRKLRDFGVHH